MRHRVLIVLAALTAMAPVGLAQPALADTPTTVTFVGQCTFSSLVSPALVATYSPQLSSLYGTGLCSGNAYPSETVTLNLSGGSGLTCLDGLESMSGDITWSKASPASQTGVAVTASGAYDNLQLVILGNGFAAVADLTWVSTSCPSPGSFSANVSGTMTFEST